MPILTRNPSLRQHQIYCDIKSFCNTRWCWWRKQLLKKNLEVKSNKRFMYLSCAWSCLWDKAVTCFTVPQGKDWLLWGKIALKSITKCLNVQLHIQLLAYSWWHKSSLIWKTECKAAHQYGKGHCALLMDHVPSIISNMNEESNWYYT